MNVDILKKLYKDYTGAEATQVDKLNDSGSNRRYFRLSGPQSIIGVLGEVREENDAFLYMDRHFLGKGLPVPRVLGVSDDHMAYIQEDLGDTLLIHSIEKGVKTRVFSDEEKRLLGATMRRLCQIQFAGAQDMDFSVCYPTPTFDERSIFWDLNYFKYCFLKATELVFLEGPLEEDFHKLADVLLSVKSDTFMYRDFQSRNVMVHNGEPWFIDFQGGRRGPYYYDVASFLWQARANYPESLRKELLKVYLDELAKHEQVDKQQFYSMLRHFVLFRMLQVLGAYGFRGYFEKKPDFMGRVPGAIAILRKLIEQPFTEYPYLNKVLNDLCNMSEFTDGLEKRQLTVKVMSFAYKKGIPNDTSGNGGGYVFDCRACNNPGKYARYKPFTGLDQPVIKFIEEDGELLEFLDHAYALVDASVARYIDRHFTNLMVCFGCTGGQHRSVYSAQHMAEHLHRKFNVKVELLHREQNIEQVYLPIQK